jgi:hypothetical protein
MKTITNNEYYNLSYKEREKFVGIVKDHNGAIFYYKDGYFHREDGPAIIYSEKHKTWYFEGLLHNLNGPAKIWPDGREEYFIHGKPTTKEAFEFLRDLCQLKNVKI